MTKTLKITMSEGKWLVDIFSQTNDSGVYDLIHPNDVTEVSLNEGEMYGFRYSLQGKPDTTFKIELGDDVLAEGDIDKSEAASGSGVV
ncbi:hypothetical protein ACI7YQ_14945 [Alteromonas marina]|uniref:hypothetical protein n=1 Tax=unclassified Alteromonas TaxID=2614992 RepID=UPI0012E56275|nr:hypothetical protein [Alteromonas sp. KUL150]GFD71989.1 hypothetical protein KUL113_14090 [Tenacibaculum sp. KUL113]GFD84719.1 hypothetical protein KUL150_07780 [Alteromonas sp. KUL150]